MRFKTLVCSLIMLGIVAPMTQAGTMDLMLQIAGRFDSVTFDPLPIVFNGDGSVQSGQPGFYQMQAVFTAAPAAGEKGWAATTFSATPAGPGLSLFTGPGAWAPNDRTFDSNGISPGGVVKIFETNTDGGVSSEDLQNIAVAIASPTISDANSNERRNKIGTAAGPAGAGVDPSPGPVTPAWLGDFFVQWDGSGLSSVKLTGHEFAFTSQNGTPTTYTDDTFLPSLQGPGSNLVLFGTSGPTDLPPVLQNHDILNVTAGDNLSEDLAAAMQTGGDPATSWALSNFSYTAAYGGVASNGTQTGAGVDNSGEFTWDTLGSSRGIYQWTVTAGNLGGEGSALLRVHVTAVPEPATFTMIGLALVGLVAYGRRR